MTRILVTNDDGYRSEGIRALAQALADIGEVTIVAPVEEASAIGMEAELESVLEAVGAQDEEQETLDPLGLTRITLNARGNLIDTVTNSGCSLSASAPSFSRATLMLLSAVGQASGQKV